VVVAAEGGSSVFCTKFKLRVSKDPCLIRRYGTQLSLHYSEQFAGVCVFEMVSCSDDKAGGAMFAGARVPKFVEQR
jgi:hypothetical protein